MCLAGQAAGHSPRAEFWSGTPSATPGQLGGHRKSKINGRLDCLAALRAIADGGYVTHRVFFADERTAIAAGYRPCAVCMPDAHQAWKAR
ncbi:MAG TPA: Ada metal-binding domain-containing protein [Streptosporangiaceae bacterium]|jgi:hypothetical protein